MGAVVGEGVSVPGPKGERGEPGPPGQGKPGKNVRELYMRSILSHFSSMTFAQVQLIFYSQGLPGLPGVQGTPGPKGAKV